uniref:Uncharacterized protein n=1 Tax=Branchiostoma floridae TaxID=7739 RepID=C3Y5P7_BRAFL|eukprot:XP_002608284.1 hypothetical protein BRAFLDRAFT_87964 [Branchiostoma floridae]
MSLIFTVSRASRRDGRSSLGRSTVLSRTLGPSGCGPVRATPRVRPVRLVRPADWTVSPWQVGMTSSARQGCPEASEVRDPPAESENRPDPPRVSDGYCGGFLCHPVGYGRVEVALCVRCNEMGSLQGKPKQISSQALMSENSELRISKRRLETEARTY